MKLLDKHLDRYYTRKLLDRIEGYLVGTHDADYRVIRSNHDIVIVCKLRCLDERYYVSIYTFKTIDSLSILCDFDNVRKDIERRYKRVIDRQRSIYK